MGRIKESYICEKENDPSFVRKRRMMLLNFTFRRFLLGCEYSIILPSVWLYVKSFSQNTLIMGVIVSIYPLIGAIALPVTGRIYDKTRRCKELVFALNFFQMIGNLIYAIPYSLWLPLIGRGLAGIGDGSYSVVSGEIAAIYQAKYRTGIFALLELGRVLGIIIGPTLNFFIAKANYQIIIGNFKWRIDYATLPGIIMAVAWSILELITVFTVDNLSKQIADEHDIDSSEVSGVCSSLDVSQAAENDEIIINSDFLDTDDNQGMVEKEKMLIPSSDDENVMENIKKDEKIDHKKPSYIPSTANTLRQLLAWEFFVIFYVDIVLWIVQTAFEVILPLVTENDYHWKQQNVGLVYMVGGIELIVIFVLIYVLGNKYPIHDAYMLLISLVMSVMGMSLFMFESYPKTILKREFIFASICVLVFGSIPLNLVAGKSLLTKITRIEGQGLVQGVYASVTRVALIAGPLLGSVAFNFRLTYGITMFSASFVGIFLIALSLNRLKQREALMVQIKVKLDAED